MTDSGAFSPDISSMDRRDFPPAILLPDTHPNAAQREWYRTDEYTASHRLQFTLQVNEKKQTASQCRNQKRDSNNSVDDQLTEHDMHLVLEPRLKAERAPFKGAGEASRILHWLRAEPKTWLSRKGNSLACPPSPEGSTSSAHRKVKARLGQG